MLFRKNPSRYFRESVLNPSGKIEKVIGRIRTEAEYIRALFNDNIDYSDKDTAEDMVVVLGSAHKVGSTWLYEMIRELGHFNYRIPYKLTECGTIMLDKPGISKYLAHIKGRIIFKCHSYPIPKMKRGKAKFVSICRDPRDVIVSSIFSLVNLDERKGGWGSEFRKLDEPQRIKIFIREEGEFTISRLEQWFRDPEAYLVRYEYLLAQPVIELRKVMDYIGCAVDDKDIENTVKRHSFKKKSGRQAGDEDKKSKYRKGISGDWKNHFDEEIISMFKHEMRGRWNKFLVEAGYERSLEW